MTTCTFYMLLMGAAGFVGGFCVAAWLGQNKVNGLLNQVALCEGREKRLQAGMDDLRAQLRIIQDELKA